MFRKLSLPVALFAVLLSATAASAQDHAGTTTYKSPKWKSSASIYDPATWAYTTVIVPKIMVAGQPTKVTFKFKAKKRLTNIFVCFSEIASAKCAFSKKFAVIPKGHTITRVLTPIVPMAVGTRAMDNYTRFLAPMPPHATGGAIWAANSFVQIVAAE